MAILKIKTTQTQCTSSLDCLFWHQQLPSISVLSQLSDASPSALTSTLLIHYPIINPLLLLLLMNILFLFVIRVQFQMIRLPSCNLSFVQIHVEVRQLVLFIASVSLAASWVVYRKEKFAWILQDILGFAFRYCCCALFCSGHSTIVYCTAQKSSSSQVRN
jgi:hypothetical protein